jgi:hypothetical protein
MAINDLDCIVTLWKGNYKLDRFWTNLLCLHEEEKLRLNDNNIYDKAVIKWGDKTITYTAGNPIPTILP